MTIPLAPSARSRIDRSPRIRSSDLGHPGGSSIVEEAVDRAAGMEIAENAIPTPAWTAHRTRRPQRPTSPVVSANGKET
jgi:hypothetical protein